MTFSLNILRMIAATTFVIAFSIPATTQVEERMAQIRMLAPENGHRVGVDDFGITSNIRKASLFINPRVKSAC